MKFSLFVHMERIDPGQSEAQLYEEMVELCRIADEGGFHAIWTGEHHGMAFTIAPNPLLNLVDLARRTKNVRLGTGTVIAPFWHPIKLAGEAAMADIISGGRIDLGVARGAYGFEYERVSPGLDAWTAGQKMREMIPALKGLWAGDYAHDGQFWQFPKTTSCPRPLQAELPIWVAARDPNSHEFAVANGCNVQVTPMAAGDEEVQSLMDKFNAACAKFPDKKRPQIMCLRHTYVADSEDDAMQGARDLSVFFNYFAAWFRNDRPIDGGLIAEMSAAEMEAFPQYSAEVLRKNHIVGQPAEVIDRVKSYQAMGYDEFSIWIDSMMPFERKKASLERFIKDVMPAFA
ncbi:LLM class flavin-dependent oxidoreductase [Rhodobacter sp. KR11]|jgi:alkanesulfonate monooxygenase SsuD/methylene tetrahydromethanopterin reductase-like flavin-dependent oxidoreductase (luciferase family)|uniref:LLM class flavin-dependent oxidoreductase n=1 Tax=Rhodobacter sp. KR11 TaxID=2974588 RepID=UPI002221DF0C|nr:LLM class flavin-dependent oxidoreductase [Rhodobacter sp. KR11]MCW1919985.1 LLM class flavin-dependent oxidoreductase [Rhodobacter sp. KR11]